MEQDVTAYINRLDPDERTALSALRQQILRLMPSLEERLSRGVPFFYYRGKRAVGFRASKNHLSFFIMEGHVMQALRQEMADFNNSSTVIRFTASNPLPKKLIEKLVLARIAEIDQTLAKKSKT